MNLDSLNRYQWTDRPLLVFADEDTSAQADKQAELLQNQYDQLTDRDMVVLWIGTSAPPGRKLHQQVTVSDQLRRKLDVPAEGFHALLIGKDGGVKLRTDEPVQPQRLYDLIDAMPMRRREMSDQRFH
ncbi:MAG: DUF4174 domain-containing protein [Phycisphaerae bacterium]